MSTMDKINELNNRRQIIEIGGGESKISKVHAEGNSTARERIEYLLDSNSFVEVGAFMKHRSTDFNMSNKETPADGVVIGYGTIEGRLVYVYSQDSTVLGGSVGEIHGKKIASIYEMAIKMGAPIIGLLDSEGLRLQESTDALEGYGSVFLKQTIASGVIPQIVAVLGDCAGGASFIPGLADFTFMTSEKSKLFLNSPNVIEDKKSDFNQIATANIHSEKSGNVNFVCENEENCMLKIRQLVEFLPSNNMEDAPLFNTTDDLNRVSEELNSLIPLDLNAEFDIKDVVKQIADNNDFFEVSKDFAKNMVVGFVRLNGGTVGIVGNQSIEKEGKIDGDACIKAAKFVKFCDAYNIPIITLTDVAGFSTSIEEEQNGISGKASILIHAFADATVPKINIIVRKAFGSAYVLMNSKHIGADIVLAWPSTQISVMNADSAVRIMFSDEINSSKEADILISEKTTMFEQNQSSPYAAASRGYIDDIIEPSSTRKRVIAAIEMLISKKENRPTKKHSTIL